MRTIGYEADGEASDWMLTTFGIVAASPELGTKDKRTSDFFIDDRDVIKDLL